MNILNHGEKHLAIVLLVDTSNTMEIDKMNEGLRLFGEALQEYDRANACADICAVKFDSTVELIAPFASAAEFYAPVLTAADSHDVAINEAILAGLDLIEQITQEYKTVGVDYWRPWMFLLTDGVPTDTNLSADAHSRLQEALENKKFNFFPMSIGEGANIAELKTYTKDGIGRVLNVEKICFKECFVYLSSNLVFGEDSIQTIILLVDTSQYMPIDKLHQAMKDFYDVLQERVHRYQISVVVYNSAVEVVVPLTNGSEFQLPAVTTTNSSEVVMNEALLAGLNLLKQARGCFYGYRPRVYLLSASEETDCDLQQTVCKRLRCAIDDGKIWFFSMRIGEKKSMSMLTFTGGFIPYPNREMFKQTFFF